MQLLTLSLGNTSLFGGFFEGGKLQTSFRRPTETMTWPARPGVDRVVLCSVVPTLTPKLIASVQRHHNLTPLVLTADSPHGLKIGYARPRQLGTDRLAAAIGARKLFRSHHVIVVDCGTATTVTALHREGKILGGAILPGLALWPEMLAARTAQLPRVALRRPVSALGRSPRAGIAAGIFHGHVGAIREVVARVRAEAFGRAPVVIAGTGGHASRFENEKLFDALEPALVLHGLRAFAEPA